MADLTGQVIDPRLQGLDLVYERPRRTVPFSGNTPVAWVEATRLRDRARGWLHRPARAGGGFFVPTSNGSAVGTDVADAIERAVCELVERHAVTLWWYGLSDVTDITGPARELCDVAGWVTDNGWTVRWYRLETELRLPAVLAVAIEQADARQRGIVVGAGVGTGRSWTDIWAAAVRRSAGEVIQAIEADALSRVSGTPLVGSPFHTPGSAAGRRVVQRLPAPAACCPLPAEHPVPASSMTAVLHDAEIEVWTLDHQGRIDLPDGFAFAEAWSPRFLPYPARSGGRRLCHHELRRHLRAAGLSVFDVPRVPHPLG